MIILCFFLYIQLYYAFTFKAPSLNQRQKNDFVTHIIVQVFKK